MAYSLANQVKSCTSVSSLRRVEAVCQSRSSCSFLATPQYLLTDEEDPCPYVRKQLSIFYQCKPHTFRSTLHCPGDIVSLSCRSSEEKILILSSSFSKASSGSIQCLSKGTRVAFEEASTLKNIQECEKINLNKALMSSCNGLSACQLDNMITVPTNKPDCKELPVNIKTTFACVDENVLKKEMDEEVNIVRQSEVETNNEFSKVEKNTKHVKQNKGYNNPVKGNEYLSFESKDNISESLQYLFNVGSIVVEREEERIISKNPENASDESKSSPHTNSMMHKVDPMFKAKKMMIVRDDHDKKESNIEKEILTDLVKSDWDVLSDNINLDILPLEQSQQTTQNKRKRDLNVYKIIEVSLS